MALVAGAGLGASVASWWLPATLLVLLLPMSELAVGLVNHLLTLLLPPRILPKLDFKDGIAGRLRHDGRHALDALPAAERGGPARAPGNPLPGESRPPAPLRPPDRLRRRPARDDARGRRLPPGCPRARAGPQRALSGRRARQILPLPPPPALEPGAGLLDGLGAQARQAGGVQSPAPGRSRDELHGLERRSGGPARRPASSSRSTPTPRCRARPPADSSGPSPTRSISRDSTRSAGAWSRDTASCSRG